MARRRGGYPRPRGIAGWLFVAPDDHHPGAVPARADRHGLLGQPHRLERAAATRSAAAQRAFVGARELHAAVHRGRPDPQRLHARRSRNNFYYVLLVVPLQTGARARPRPGRQQQAAQGHGLLPHGVLLPVGDQLGRHLVGLPLPLLQHRRGQRAARLRRHRRPAVVQPTPRGLLHIALGWFGVGARRPPAALASARSSGLSLVGLALRARRSRCASSSSWSSGPPPAPSC